MEAGVCTCNCQLVAFDHVTMLRELWLITETTEACVKLSDKLRDALRNSEQYSGDKPSCSEREG